jgi:hypothetical protein
VRRSILVVVAAILGSASAAAAQTEGRISVGGSVTVNQTIDGDVGAGVGVGPLVRLNPRPGWGPAGAFNWYRAELRDPAGGDGDFARLRVRPLMAGVAYSVASGNVLTSFSIVAGPSFNKASFHGDYVASGGETLDVDTSLAIRPGVGVTFTLAPRVAIVGFGGYLFNRPDIRYRNRAGQERQDQWKADAVVLSVGVVYSIF